MPEDWYRGRASVPIEVLAVIMIVMGVLVIVFPHLIAWFVGLVLIAAGVLWLMGAWNARRPYGPPAYAPPQQRPPYAPPR